ncbi:MAG TPA: NAD-dependent epimerase/dehydratase family protein [Caldimonas sp.]
MNILILGGGVFLGAATLDAALARGHALTAFNRGRARSAWPDGVEVLVGDRATDLERVRGRRFDAVVDTCGYVPADVRAACLFVSSISAYASFEHAPVVETDALASHAGIDPADRDLRFYGAQKAACEAEVTRVFGPRSLIVRPGLIVGPRDRSGRFSHWPWRAAAGGEMLVPDTPLDEPLQFIDVRDLAGWMVHLLEAGARGVFNATGPTGGHPCTWAALIGACSAEAGVRGATEARPVPVGEAFLEARSVKPWSELPLWLPSHNATHHGHPRVSLARAEAAGLRTRPLGETVGAILDEPLPGADDPRRAGKLTRAREAELIALWRAEPRAA